MLKTPLKIAVAWIFLIHGSASACSAFVLQDHGEVRIGKSYDWWRGLGHGNLYVNKRGLHKTTGSVTPAANLAQWVSKWGSVTFTQFGKGFPIGGMNEQGLVVEMLELDNTRYNTTPDSRPLINESQWTQYQLDQYKSVAEVLAHLEDLRVAGIYIGIHYFVADATGSAATVEFLDGKAVVHTGADLPVPVLTNSIYSKSLNYLHKHAADKVHQPLFQETSNARFVLAARGLTQSLPSEDLTTAAFHVLRLVKEAGMAGVFQPSQWHLVYDPKALEVDFRSRAARDIKSLNFKDLKFAPDAEEKMADINALPEGDVAASLVKFTPAANREAINKNRLILGPSKRRLAAQQKEF